MKEKFQKDKYLKKLEYAQNLRPIGVRFAERKKR